MTKSTPQRRRQGASLPLATLPRPSGLQPAAPTVIMWPFMEAERRGPSAGGTGHFHWQVVAFNEYDKVREIFVDSLTVNVEAPTEQLAIIRAQEIIERRWYRISNVTETCEFDPNLKAEA